nr:immunoglobulin light chain junction region [Macaca mulatta]MOW67837.1 immunoglobulin light chain junction region [Macaca mulatta]MOW69065.1 immunoglobulin light chain junction region [Macaca mulatta]MOW69167.1 immunoglobulin light chain junction region [Macaca mulatta]MOW69265.1 immunoglobulin light chain junction region [Macaca mulatta]
DYYCAARDDSLSGPLF